MKKLHTISVGVFLAFSSFLLFADKAKADIKMTTGDPIRDGNMVLQIEPRPGIGNLIQIPLEEQFSPEDKAKAIRDAIANLDINNIVPELNGNMLVFPANVKKISFVDNTGEFDELRTTNNQKPKLAKLDGGLINELEPLSGLDDNGNESLFMASLGFQTPTENVSINSEFLFSELGGDTVNDWISNIFNDFQEQLPEIYQSNLSLNSASDEILFNFPNNILLDSGFISNQATDTNAATSLEIALTPEPSSLLGFLIIGGLGIIKKIKK